MTTLDAHAICGQLGLASRYRTWIGELGREPGPVEPAPVPRGKRLAQLLRSLGTAEEDVAEILDCAEEVLDADTPLRLLLDRAVQRLVSGVGDLTHLHAGPDLPAHLGAAGRYFHVFVYLGALPAVRSMHRQRGISDEVSWASLADLGNKIGVYRRTYGLGGFDQQLWTGMLFRGNLYRLGRLQFNRIPPDEDGVPTLGVHIPEDGPLDAEECGAALYRAGDFFPRHFPEFFAGHDPSECGVLVHCTSWLLDPQLAEYLPADSNILRFQRRFELLDVDRGDGDEWDDEQEVVPDGMLSDADRSIVEFVFRRMPASREELLELPTRSRLERAVVRHIRAGRHWQTPSGRLTVPPHTPKHGE